MLRGNEILMIFQGHNFVVNLQKLMHINPNLDLVKVHVYAKDQIPFFHSEDIEKKQNSAISVINLTCNNPNIDLFKVIAYARFDQIPLICSEDNGWKLNSDKNQGS